MEVTGVDVNINVSAGMETDQPMVTVQVDVGTRSASLNVNRPAEGWLRFTRAAELFLAG